ncbi:hypothetical protein J6590_017561, partial [Homalodisca vitripennis]
EVAVTVYRRNGNYSGSGDLEVTHDYRISMITITTATETRGHVDSERGRICRGRNIERWTTARRKRAEAETISCRPQATVDWPIVYGMRWRLDL